jgi:hypothetical protein
VVRTLGLDHARQVDVRAVGGDGSDQRLLLGRQQGRRGSHRVPNQVDPASSQLALRQEVDGATDVAHLARTQGDVCAL